jgi:hypothetical protein
LSVTVQRPRVEQLLRLVPLNSGLKRANIINNSALPPVASGH